jgi:hypothetical protein
VLEQQVGDVSPAGQASGTPMTVVNEEGLGAQMVDQRFDASMRCVMDGKPEDKDQL